MGMHGTHGERERLTEVVSSAHNPPGVPAQIGQTHDHGLEGGQAVKGMPHLLDGERGHKAVLAPRQERRR